MCENDSASQENCSSKTHTRENYLESFVQHSERSVNGVCNSCTKPFYLKFEIFYSNVSTKFAASEILKQFRHFFNLISLHPYLPFLLSA